MPDFPNSIKEINVFDNKISGPLPTTFSSNLTVFDATFNQLNGTINCFPDSVQNINLGSNLLTGNISRLPAQLQSFRIFNNLFTGELPNKWPATVNHIHIGSNRFSGAFPFSLLQ
eukprot:NODE_975_length_2816_cov_0.464851.p3 type:complete len:115 gc:universal NODE_975_length_2816_cov_0.464851:1257-913(-)